MQLVDPEEAASPHPDDLDAYRQTLDDTELVLLAQQLIDLLSRGDGAFRARAAPARSRERPGQEDGALRREAAPDALHALDGEAIGRAALHIGIDRVAGYRLRTPDGFQRA